MSSVLFTSWKIPTGLKISRYGELTYEPGISVTFSHEFPDWPLHDFRKGPSMSFGHSLGFSRIDWHSNYREGLSVSFDNSYSLNFFRLSNEKAPMSISYSLGGTGHFIIAKFFGISSRLQYRQWFYHDPDYNDQAGDVMRGIASDTIKADYMLSLNMDFPLRVLVFTPSEWLNNRKLRFFDFELHASPVFDTAFYHNPEKKDVAAAGGLELIVFPAFMRNLYVRVGFACNLGEFFTSRPIKLPDGDNREIYIMMGHFY
jgi:hypothetical protein